MRKKKRKMRKKKRKMRKKKRMMNRDLNKYFHLNKFFNQLKLKKKTNSNYKKLNKKIRILKKK